MGRPNLGGHIRKLGNTFYLLIRVNGKQRLAHRVIMEKIIGRTLRCDELIHHKDHNGLNNIASNLEIVTQSKHMSIIHEGERRSWSFDEALRLREKGKSFAYIAKHFNVNYGTIIKVFKRKGLSTINLRWGKYKWDTKTGVKLFKQGIPIAQIAKQLDVTPPCVRKYLIKQKYLI